MKHAKHPTKNYDFAPIASILGKYNTRDFQNSKNELDNALGYALDEIETNDKQPVPHTAPELINGIRLFLHQTILPILNEVKDRVSTEHQLRIENVIADYCKKLDQLPKPSNGEWLCDQSEIEAMFELEMTEGKSWETIESDNKKWKKWMQPQSHDALNEIVSIEEVRSLFAVVREKLLCVAEFNPILYSDKGQGHHLFWSPTKKGEECIIPNDYSLADYLRFHCPHNDAHLAHLNANAEKSIISYSDYMDERAFSEAVSVHAEWQMFESAQVDDFSYHLYSQLHPGRQKGISKDEFQDWIVNCRGYEFRLRLVRLLGDTLTFFKQHTFNEAVNEAVKITGVQKEDVKAEIGKYYHFPGLGAVYTLGYNKLLESGATKTQDTFLKNNQLITTWHQF